MPITPAVLSVWKNELEMVNLETGETLTWTSSRKGLIDDFMLSDKYLVLVSEEIW